VSPRASTIRADKIDYGFWLIFGHDGSMRFTRTEPSVDRNERKMSAQVTLPRSIFRTPELRAVLTVADPGQTGHVIDIQAASDALKGALGVDVEVRIMPQEGT
jgi:hypothetical protein